MKDAEIEDLIRGDIDSDITVRLPDNIAMISFVNDAGAYMFGAWWEGRGKAAFAEWAKSDDGLEVLDVAIDQGLA